MRQFDVLIRGAKIEGHNAPANIELKRQLNWAISVPHCTEHLKVLLCIFLAHQPLFAATGGSTEYGVSQ
jgi:hypothetical protein